MRPCLLILCLSVGLLSQAWTEDAVPAPVEAVSTAAAVPVAEPAPAPRVYTKPGRQVIGNDHAQVSVSDWRGSIGDMALKDLRPLTLPSWRGVPGRDGESVAAAKDLKVLSTINPAQQSLGYAVTDMNNFIKGMGLTLVNRADVGRGPREDVWTVAGKDDTSVTMTFTDTDINIAYVMTLRMDPERPTVHCFLTATNHAPTEHQLQPTLVAINGVHQDDPGHESYDLAVVACFGGTPAGFWYASTPTKADLPIPDPSTDQPLLDPAKVDYIGLKSRFFTALWKPGSLRIQAPQVTAPTVPAPRDLNRDEDLPGTAASDAFRIKATCRPFLRRFPAGQEHQAAIEIDFLPANGNVFVLPPGGVLSIDWSLTVSSLRDEHLALLTPAEQQIQYADWYYRFFKMLVKPMEWLLALLASVLHVTGLAVIVLVIVVKGALHRLNFKAQSSMAKMQKLGPQLKALQDRYGHDRQQAAMKQMELFKKEGVNPVGGCLPILLQMPVFIALYQAFRHSADLRGQGFLWVRDLTLPDQVLHLFDLAGISFTINPLPLLYIAVMLFISIRTKLPAGAQLNEQAVMMQKMMRWLPVVFGVIFYNMPAGLVLYFVCSAIIGSLEMAWIRKKLGMNVTPTMPVM